MKLRNIFTALAAAALAFVGCQEEERFLDEVQVSKSIISLPIEGGKDTLTVTANAEWTMELPKDAWFTVDLASGAAGETQVVFEAEASSANREANLSIVCAGARQTVKVIQMAERVPAALATCKQVLDDHAAGVAVGKNYKIKGTVTDLTNYGKYGCFYVNDGTGQVYVYGSMNSAQFDPAVGDIITFEGPWTSYGNFDDVTILELEKSLLSVVKVAPEGPVSLDGGKVSVTLSIKAKEHEVVIPDEAKEWLTFNEKDVIVVGETTYIYDFILAANPAGARRATVTFKATVDGVDYSAAFDVEQEGAIAAVTVAEFLATAEGTALYELTGVVKNLTNTTYGNFDLVDATGSVYVYGLTNNGAIGANDKKFAEIGINEGDVITIVGTRAAHNGKAQVGGTAYLKEHVIAATESTVSDFLAKSESSDNWYKLTGTISNIVKDKNDPTKDSAYGNFDLTDETGTVYVYGLTVAPVASNDKSFPNLGLKEGDVVTLVGTRAAFNGSAQVGGPAYYVSHEAGATEPEEPETPADPETPVAKTLTLTNAEICAAMTSSETSYVDYTIESASGVWTVNASRNNANTFLQCRGKKGAYIKTPAFDQDIKSVTLHFSEAKSVYANNVYCVFPSTWTVPTADAAYPEDGNVGRAVTDSSYSLTIPVNAGNKQVYISIIGTYSYYLDHIDVAF